ncbi:MAG: riboflavin synthase [bacterium]
MFTGIIQALGEVASVESKAGDLRLEITTGMAMDDVNPGDSIATNGVCLTVIELTGTGYIADVSAETLSLTTVGDWKPGKRVNLEPAMLPSTRFGGHIVSGHVDGVGEIVSSEGDARSVRFWVRAPEPLAKYIAHKGSIAVDGTSLTVNKVDGAAFDLNIVPHTMEHTVMGDYQPGSRVNLEVDLVARYLERMLSVDPALRQQADSLTRSQ